jgi:hypothetical protein
MPELGSFGSARGVPGNGHSYRKPGSLAEVQVILTKVRFAPAHCRRSAFVRLGRNSESRIVGTNVDFYTVSVRYKVPIPPSTTSSRPVT